MSHSGSELGRGGQSVVVRDRRERRGDDALRAHINVASGITECGNHLPNDETFASVAQAESRYADDEAELQWCQHCWE